MRQHKCQIGSIYIYRAKERSHKLCLFFVAEVPINNRGNLETNIPDLKARDHHSIKENPGLTGSKITSRPTFPEVDWDMKIIKKTTLEEVWKRGRPERSDRSFLRFKKDCKGAAKSCTTFYVKTSADIKAHEQFVFSFLC